MDLEIPQLVDNLKIEKLSAEQAQQALLSIEFHLDNDTSCQQIMALIRLKERISCWLLHLEA